MRSVIVCVFWAAACTHAPSPPSGNPKIARAPKSACAVESHPVGLLTGAGAMRPQIAGAADAFAVVWEETGASRRARVQTFGVDGKAIALSNVLGDPARSSAEPRVAVGGDGSFAAFYAANENGESRIYMQKVDRKGAPLGESSPVASAPGARPLAAAALDGGFVLAWWNWTGLPHRLFVSSVSARRRAPAEISSAPSADPTVDLAAGGVVGARAPVIAWEELVDNVEHVVTGELAKDGLASRVDVGPGETPELGRGVVVFERPKEQALYVAGLDGKSATRLGEGHVPAAAPLGSATALCFLRDTDPAEDAHLDELECGLLADGRLRDLTPVTRVPGEIQALQVAVAGAHIGVVWQTQGDKDAAVGLAIVSCPRAATALRENPAAAPTTDVRARR